MPVILPINIIGGAYESRDRNSIQELINMYVEVDNTGGDAQYYLRGTHGLTEWFDSSESEEVRGFDIFQGVLYAVIGDTLYSISGPSSAGGTKTAKGALATSAGQCKIFNDGTKLGLCDGSSFYGLTQCLVDKGNITVAGFLALTSGIYGDYYTFTDSGSGITAGQIGVLNKAIDALITSDDYEIFDSTTETALTLHRAASYLAYQDGWFIISVPNTGSALTTTDFGTWVDISAEGNPDFIVSLISDHRELIIFNEKTIEIDYITGSATLPFARTSGGFIETGCGAKNSPVKVNNIVYFLDDNNQVRALSALQTQIVSTPQISYQIGELDDPQEAIGYTYSIEGHVVYVLTFPGANVTYCFDTTTNIWYKWSTGGYNNRHTSNCFIRYNGKNLVGDKENGIIYEIDPSSRLDGETPIYRERTTQYTHNASRTTFFERLLLEIQTATELSGDPKMMLDFTDDFGKTWSTPIEESLGQVGEYGERVEFYALGSAKYRAFRIRITDEFFVSLQRAHLFGGVSWE